MGDSFTAVPSAIAQMGGRFLDEGAQLAQSASGFSGDVFQVADAFGLLGACDGAMQKYIAMARSTTQGLEQLAQLWESTGEQLTAQAEVYQAVEEQNEQQLRGVMKPLDRSGGGR